jgi:NADPH-dependent 2,4-dienoyl-CoA reductase/sulfur reductase-like enzyme
MERREFLKSAIPAAVLLHGGFGGPSLFATEKDGSTSDFGAYDLVVIGGTLFGCFAARRAARKGQRVLLIERRTFLGTDITATLRPWLHRQSWKEFGSEMKELFLPEAGNYHFLAEITGLEGQPVRSWRDFVSTGDPVGAPSPGRRTSSNR